MSKSAEHFLLKTPKSFFKSLARNNSHFDLDGVQMRSANSSRRHQELVPLRLIPGGRDGSSRQGCSLGLHAFVLGPSGGSLSAGASISSPVKWAYDP